MKVLITVEVEDGDPSADPDHSTGLTNDAYERLTSSSEHGAPPLSWLGEVVDIEKEAV